MWFRFSFNFRFFHFKNVFSFKLNFCVKYRSPSLNGPTVHGCTLPGHKCYTVSPFTIRYFLNSQHEMDYSEDIYFLGSLTLQSVHRFFWNNFQLLMSLTDLSSSASQLYSRSNYNFTVSLYFCIFLVTCYNLLVCLRFV